jgi:hypothetical protein
VGVVAADTALGARRAMQVQKILILCFVALTAKFVAIQAYGRRMWVVTIKAVLYHLMGEFQRHPVPDVVVALETKAGNPLSQQGRHP